MDLPSKDEVRAVPFSQPAPGRRLGLVWRAGAGRNDAYQELSGLLRGEMARLLDDARKALSKRQQNRARRNASDC